MKLRTLICLGPIIFLIHDLEEVFTVEKWVKGHRDLFKKIGFAKSFVAGSGYTTAEFAITVAFIFLMFIIISRVALKNQQGFGMKCFVAAIMVLFVNVYTHLAQTLYFKMYTPGVVTALFMVLPFTIYVFFRLKKEHLFSKSSYLQSLGIGILFVPIIFAPLFILNQLFH